MLRLGWLIRWDVLILLLEQLPGARWALKLDQRSWTLGPWSSGTVAHLDRMIHWGELILLPEHPQEATWL